MGRIAPPLRTLLVVLLAACGGSAGAAPDTGGPPRLRIRLVAASARETVRIAAAGEYEILDAETGERKESGKDLSRSLPPAAAGIEKPLRLRAAAAVFSVDGREYPGELLLVPADGRVALVAETDLETYVPGVLAGELGAGYPGAALRAQAIAARTYALARVRRAPDATWHVADDTSSQVWRGRVTGDDGVLAGAARDTAGLVLVWDGKLLPTWYHSTCGGHTAPAREVFGEADVPPFAGVPCAFCAESPRFSYRVRIPREEVRAALGLSAPPETATITGRGADGRALALRFGPGGETRTGVDVRSRLGPERLPSTLLDEIARDGDALVFAGRGFGHGVGLCQWGAIVMARRGAGAADVLAHYYPGAAISRIY